jgi:hypothetical protein
MCGRPWCRDEVGAGVRLDIAQGVFGAESESSPQSSQLAIWRDVES